MAKIDTLGSIPIFLRILIILVVIASAVVVIGFGTGEFILTTNRAQLKAWPLVKDMRQLGGMVLCSNGDPGFGPDNTAPWYTTYFTVANKGDLADQITKYAAANGFTLKTNTPYIDDLQTGNNISVGINGPDDVYRA